MRAALASAWLLVAVSVALTKSTASADDQTIVDAYYVNFHCDAARSELAAASKEVDSGAVGSAGRDSMGDMADGERQVDMIHGLGDQLNAACQSMLENVATNAVTNDRLATFLSTIDSVTEKARELASPAATGPLAELVQLQPLKSESYWADSPETARLALDQYLSARASRVQNSLLQRKFNYYVTLLIVDSSTSQADAARLHEAFVHLGRFIGDDRAAIWLGRYGDPEEPDVDHARIWMVALQAHTRYRLSAAGGPYLIFSKDRPDQAKDLFVVDLGPYSMDGKVRRIDEVAQDLNDSSAGAGTLDPARAYWEDVELRFSEVLGHVFGSVFHV